MRERIDEEKKIVEEFQALKKNSIRRNKFTSGHANLLVFIHAAFKNAEVCTKLMDRICINIFKVIAKMVEKNEKPVTYHSRERQTWRDPHYMHPQDLRKRLHSEEDHRKRVQALDSAKCCQ